MSFKIKTKEDAMEFVSVFSYFSEKRESPLSGPTSFVFLESVDELKLTEISRYQNRWTKFSWSPLLQDPCEEEIIPDKFVFEHRDQINKALERIEDGNKNRT